MSDPLFADVDPRAAGDGLDEAPVRYETANRGQIELQPCDLEALLPPGHAARLVWRFVGGLDLSAFYATIRAREGRVWLYATMDGVGSARVALAHNMMLIVESGGSDARGQAVFAAAK